MPRQGFHRQNAEANEADMDTKHCLIAGLLALKDAPDDVLLDQVRAIGVTATRYMLFDEADRCSTPTRRRRRTAPP
jgi:hypothetical protein